MGFNQPSQFLLIQLSLNHLDKPAVFIEIGGGEGLKGVALFDPGAGPGDMHQDLSESYGGMVGTRYLLNDRLEFVAGFARSDFEKKHCRLSLEEGVIVGVHHPLKKRFLGHLDSNSAIRETSEPPC